MEDFLIYCNNFAFSIFTTYLIAQRINTGNISKKTIVRLSKLGRPHKIKIFFNFRKLLGLVIAEKLLITIRIGFLESSRYKLERAGYRRKSALVNFIFIKILLCVFMILFMTNFVSGILSMVLIPVCIVLAHIASEIALNKTIDKRYYNINTGISDMLDLLTICINTGMNIRKAMHKTAEDLFYAHPVLAEEVMITAQEMSLDANHERVLKRLAQRVNLRSIEAIVNTIVQSVEYGTPIKESLNTLADDYRKTQLLDIETKAAKIPAMMSLPMLFFILPTLFIVVIGPIIIKAMINGM